MRKPIAIAVAQPVCEAYDIAANVGRHAAAVRAAQARVVVFPELSLTGYHLDAPAIAPADLRLAPLVRACADAGSVALVGAPLAGGRAPYIAMLAVDGAGTTVAYRKQWVDASEAHRFAAGESPAVCQVDGWRLGLAICRDTGIARHASDTAGLGIDAYVAGILMSVDETAVLAERGGRIATTQRVWVALASFAGSTGHGYDPAVGRSAIWAPDGTVLAQAGHDPGTVLRATLR